MSKPRGLVWLEAQTGQEIPYEEPVEPACSSPDRRVSVRLDGDLARAAEALAAEHGVPVSEYIRRLLAAAVEHDGR